MPEFPIDVLELPEKGSDPGATANTGKVYTKDVAGVTQLFYQASDGSVAQGTPVLPNPGSIAFSDRTILFTAGPGGTIPSGSANTPVNIFSSGGDEASLAANSTYMFSAHIILTNSPATTVLSMLFAGTATYSSFEYSFRHWTATTGSEYGVVNTPSVVACFSAGRSTPYILTFDGTLRTSSAGTFIPQIQLSPSVASNTVVRAGSFMELIYLGSDTYISQGGWG